MNFDDDEPQVPYIALIAVTLIVLAWALVVRTCSAGEPQPRRSQAAPVAARSASHSGGGKPTVCVWGPENCHWCDVLVTQINHEGEFHAVKANLNQRMLRLAAELKQKRFPSIVTFKDPAGADRYVVWLNHADLEARYLKTWSTKHE
jgi:hypothetical protein